MQELVVIFTDAVLVSAVAFATVNLCLGLAVLAVIRVTNPVRV